MKKFLAATAVIVLTLYAVALLVPQSVPLLDSNRQALAETAREGYCAGVVIMNTRGYGSYEQMTDCLETNGRSTDRDLDSVQKEFCNGVYAVAGMPTEDCMEIVLSRQYWPTLKGTVTNSWNRAFPYPGSTALDVGTSNDRASGGDRAADQTFSDPGDR